MTPDQNAPVPEVITAAIYLVPVVSAAARSMPSQKAS